MVEYEINGRWVSWLRRLRQWTGLLLVIAGSAVFLGWILNNEVLKRIRPGLVAMNPVTALGFVMGGASLLCFWEWRERRRVGEILGGILAAAVVALGILKLGEYLFGWRLLFDQMLFHSQLLSDGTGFTNQIAPNTALNFALCGLALWFLNASPRRFSKYAQNFGLTLALISLIPLVGYLYQATYLYSVGSYIPMALHTAFLFLLLAAGIVLAQLDEGAMALLLSRTPGGAIAQRLLPFAFGVPIALGALQMWGVKKGLYPASFGTILMVVGCVGIFGSLVWRSAILLNRSDERRREAEKSLQKAHDQLETRVQERTLELNRTNRELCLHISELEAAQRRIRQQAELLDKAKDAIVVLDTKGKITYWNKGAEFLYGWDAEEVLGENIRELVFKNDPSYPSTFEKVIQDGAWKGDREHLAKNGKTVNVESHWTRVNDEQGRPKSVLLINTDVTEKKQYEAQMLRAQRMDGIGALAGGIAHDLNNALAPVLMSAEILRENLDSEERNKFLDIITSSSQRAIQMVKQILRFARGSQSENAPILTGNVVREMAKMIRETFPKSISIRHEVEPKDTWQVKGDITELHQILLNLCVNARDAMPNGGELTLSVKNVRLDSQSHLPALAPGPYVALAVSDTGTGIPPHVLPRIFEPFFTTKAPEKGTGLGLSTVASIVKHWGGVLDVQTKSGQGTEFTIYLPAVESAPAAEPSMPAVAMPEGHGELILVMDDEEGIRELTRTMLETFGYRVVTAFNGLHGIAVFEERKDEIKLVITDSDMPHLDGLSAVCSMQQLRPDIPAIIASGGKQDTAQLQRLHAKNLTNLGKPFSLSDLLDSVARALHPH
jgi:two-component system, cell cycle sensor histidine kinase and response regulator CckA